MRIGLARHFQIPHSKVRFLSSAGFSEWIKWYDASAAETAAAESALQAAAWSWDKCFCSDLRRAAFTAGHLHAGPVEFTALLREVPFAPLFASSRVAPLKLPLYFWETLSRLGWMIGHASQPESRAQTLRRVKDFLDQVHADHAEQNILIVSHGFLMQYLQKELMRAGYKGRVPVHPTGGIIYPFERK